MQDPHQQAPNTLLSVSPAPSQVVVVHQESTGQNSVTLLWQEPDQPNGIILEYEIKYYEKVTLSSLPQSGPSTVDLDRGMARFKSCWCNCCYQQALHKRLFWKTLWLLC